MYCVKCGVELANSERVCPLCGTRVYHPNLPQPRGERLYPPFEETGEQFNARGVLFVVTALCVIVAAMSLLIDLKTAGCVVWSGYAIGGLITVYIIAALPLWFTRPNPVVLVPCDFAAATLYVLYIDLATGGRWFLSLAFPAAGMACLLSTAVVVLMRYARRGWLFIFGGALMLGGVFLSVLELLIAFTFGWPLRLNWSPYPLTGLFLLGLLLLLVAICRPLRESLKKKFFI